VQAIYRTQLGFWEGVEISSAEEKELKELYLSAISNTGKDTHTMYKTIHQLGDAGIRLLNKKARVGWTSHSHTAHAVPVFAIGVGAERFSGWHDNTEIVPLIRKAIE
jgi:alkaline phosphatase